MRILDNSGGPRWITASVPFSAFPAGTIPKIARVGDAPAYLHRSFPSGTRHLYCWFRSAHDASGQGPDIVHDEGYAAFPVVPFQPAEHLTPADITPTVLIGGVPLKATYGMVASSPAKQEFRLVWKSDEVSLVLYVTAYANSPAVFYDGFLFGLDSLADFTVDVSLFLPVADRLLHRAGPDWRLDRQPVRFTVGCAVPVRFTAMFRPEDEASAGEWDAIIQDAGWQRCAFQGDVLLGDVAPAAEFFGGVQFGTALNRPYPFAAEIDANAPGSQQNIGSNCFAPLFRGQGTALLRSVDDWLLRPCIIRSKSGDRLIGQQEFSESRAEVSDRRVRNLGYLALPEIPPMREPQAGRRPHDEQHQEDHVLHAAFALTGDRVTEELLTMLRVIDANTSRAPHGWTNSAPRGDGRWARSLTRSIACVGDPEGMGHGAIRSRAAAILEKSGTLVANDIQHPWAWHSDLQVAVYEYATAAHGFWLAWVQSGYDPCYSVARRAAVIVLSALHPYRGAWAVPYRVSVPATSDPGYWTDAELSADAVLMERGNPDWIFWCSAGIEVGLAISTMHPGDIPAELVRRGRAASEWLALQRPASAAVANHVIGGLTGEAP